MRVLLPPDLNLAARPVTNHRPVRRIAILLAVVALGIAALDGWLFWNYQSQASATLGELESTRLAAVAEIEKARRLEESIRSTDVERMNERVEYLNRRIAERTFPWGRLFDGLADVLPRGVRLVDLSRLSIADERVNQTGGSRTAGGRTATAARGAADKPGEEGFGLRLAGVAETGPDLLALVDALFRSPLFFDVDLRNENRDAAGIRFEISVTYRPQAVPEAVPAGSAR